MAEAPRRLRADGRRNRERLMETAKDLFAQRGTDVSLDEIARSAGVGIGTLYRHFPTRAAMIEEVYRRAVDELAEAADDLLLEAPPGAALRRWLKLAVGHIAAKKVVASALVSSELYASSGPRIMRALFLLIEHARAAGEIRKDTDAEDVLRALVGFTYGTASADWQASALRLVDILMDGLEYQRGEAE